MVDSFIDPAGAFCSCLLCSTAFELSGEALESYLPFEYTAPDGPGEDMILLVHPSLLTTL